MVTGPLSRSWDLPLGVRALIGLVLLLALGPYAHSASISATVDRAVVGINESFQLVFEADGSTGEPDFTPLTENFEILDQTHSKNLSIVNGQTSHQLVWNLVLMATKTGNMQIPAVSFGSDNSQAIDIVVKAKVDDKDREETMYLDIEFDNEQPYVQQQVIFSVRLFLRQGEVSSASLTEMDIEGVDAIVEQLGNDKSYQEMRNGVRWRVVERKYLVFPQQSGHMTIHPFEFKGFIRTRATVSSFDIFRQTPAKRFVLRSESITLRVREPPTTFGARWLPAKNVRLDETWPIEGEIKVGDPITREIRLQAVGLTAAQLPELNIMLPDGLRAYPEQPKLENKGDANGVIGTRIETAAIIPTRPGTIILPEVGLAWWNVEEQQPELAIIPARTLKVVAGAVDPSTAPAAPAAGEEKQIGTTDGNALGMESVQFDSRTWWPWLSLGLGVAWLITVFLWVADRRRTLNGRQPSGEMPPRVDPKKALADLKLAVQTNDAGGCRDALLNWGQALWPTAVPTNLGSLAALCGGPLSTHIRDLEQVLYARKTDWDGRPLWREAKAYKVREDRTLDAAQMPLEPLYRG